MLWATLLVLSLTLWVSLLGSAAKMFYTAKEIAINLTSPEKVFMNATIEVKGDVQKRTSAVISASITNFLPLDKLEIVLQMQLSSPNCDLCHRAVNINVDICKLLRTRGPLNFINRAFLVIQRYGAVPTSCPIQPKQYDIRNVSIDSDFMPSYLPVGPIDVTTDVTGQAGNLSFDIGRIVVKGVIWKL